MLICMRFRQSSVTGVCARACVVHIVYTCSTQALESHANTQVSGLSGALRAMRFTFYHSFTLLLTFTVFPSFFCCTVSLCKETKGYIIKKSRDIIPLYSVQKMLMIRINNNL